jgi:rSAM/selenodomain-associated transferase 1
MFTATLVMFAKLPIAGRVKTRLIPVLGEEGAAQLADAFLLDLTARLARTLDKHIDCLLCFDPPGAQAQFRAALSGIPHSERFRLVPQGPGDLGRRLAHALREVRKIRAAPCAFIGSDAPDVTRRQIVLALHRARQGRAHIVPARDGGYVLLALPHQAPTTVFDSIDWSTGAECRQQQARILESGIPCSVDTTVWSDVDEAADLPVLVRSLNATPNLAPRTLAFLRSREPDVAAIRS